MNFMRWLLRRTGAVFASFTGSKKNDKPKKSKGKLI